MRILVTGGSGFIGSHLTEHLLEVGNQVVVLDNFSTGQDKNLSRVINNSKLKVLNGSILDKELLGRVCKDVDYIFHLAAAVGVLNIVRAPLKSLFTNIRGTENVLEIADQLALPVFFC